MFIIRKEQRMKLVQLFILYKQEKPDLSFFTFEKYQRVYKLFIKDTGIDHIFVNRDECIKWRNKIFKRTSAITANNYHRHMKALFNLAVNLNIINKNPFKLFKPLKVHKIKSKIVKESTINNLKTMLKNDSYYSNLSWFYLTMIDVLSYSAIRRRQLVGIKWRDIDFENKTLYLAAEFSKNGNDNLIPLNSMLFYKLKEFKTMFKSIEQSDQVFNITKLVKLYKPNEFSETTEAHISGLFRRFSIKIDEPISPHRFRHAFASTVANKGCNLEILSKFMSHKDIRTTASYIETNINGYKKIQDLL